MLYQRPIRRREMNVERPRTVGKEVWYLCPECKHVGAMGAWEWSWAIRRICPKCKTRITTVSAFPPQAHLPTTYAVCGQCQKLHKCRAIEWRADKPCEKCGGELAKIRPQVKGNWEALGFRWYSDYLKSDLWRRTRTRVLWRDNRKCQLCGRKATQAHHLSYHIEVLAGDNLKPIMAMCRQCHKEIEFDESGRKRVLHEANHEIKCRIAEEEARKARRRKKTARRRRPNVSGACS